MQLPRSFRVFCSVLMAFMMVNVSDFARAEAAKEMISTTSVVEELSRDEAQADVQAFMSREDFQQELLQMGLSPDEVSARVASLSDADLNQLATEMNKAQFGGIGDILVIVVLVLLIIFLAKRI